MPNFKKNPKAAGSPYKMKGNPMQRNFGIGGSPLRDEKKKYTEEQQQAINQGKLKKWNLANPNATQEEMNAEQRRIWAAAAAASGSTAADTTIAASKPIDE